MCTVLHSVIYQFFLLGALVITPTRELAYQIFETLKKIGKYHDFSAGLVIGGKDLKYETDRLSNCNIIICTPGKTIYINLTMENLSLIV